MEWRINGKMTEVIVKQSVYDYNGRLALELCKKTKRGSFIQTDVVLTTNLRVPGLAPDQAFLDVNNHPEAVRLVEENKLGKATGYVATSGFVTYPLYRFDLDRITQLEQEARKK